MLQLTPIAREKIQVALERAMPARDHLRIEVRAGFEGFEYRLAAASEDDLADDDLVLDQGAFRIVLDRQSAQWLFTVLVERRPSFVHALEERGIPTSVVHRRIDRHSVFGRTRARLTGQDFFDERQISIPLHSSLSDREVQQIVEGVRAGW